MKIERDQLRALLIRLYSEAGVLLDNRTSLHTAIEATALEVFVHGYADTQEEDVQLLRELVQASWDSDLQVVP